MDCYTKIDDDLFYVGYSDRRIELFENVYPVPEGISYNSYLLLDEKTALFDAVDSSVSDIFLENIEKVLNGRSLDYLIVNHVEPDHSSSIDAVLRLHPEAEIVCTAGAKKLLAQFFDENLASRAREIEKMDGLNLGKHNLKFFRAPMVHWPEVMVSYDEQSKTLFSADAFGSFGAIAGSIYADERAFDEKIKETYRRYYVNIVGKFGQFVQNTLKQLGSLEISRICPLHGRIWRQNLPEIIDLYDKWSRYEPEEKGVLIAYASVYGGTELACNKLANLLCERGVKNISMFDVSKTHPSYLLSEVAKLSHLVLASTTYNLGVFVAMDGFVRTVANHLVSNRKIALIENGTWAPAAKEQIAKILENCKGITFTEKSVTIRSRLSEQDMEGLVSIADEIANDICKNS